MAIKSDGQLLHLLAFMQKRVIRKRLQEPAELFDYSWNNGDTLRKPRKRCLLKSIQKNAPPLCFQSNVSSIKMSSVLYVSVGNKTAHV